MRLQIETELEWLACDQPIELRHAARGRVDPLRFRWLAADWGGRIRHVFEPDDLPWFDAFDAWVAGTGPCPAEVCPPPPDFTPLDRPQSATFWARRCAGAIRRDDPLDTAAYAGVSASEDYPFVALPAADYSRSHRGRSAASRAAEQCRIDAHREEWWADMEAHGERVRREFCDQFRDVAGNLIRPAGIRPEWQTATVTALARAIHTAAAFDRMPILADALQEAGCEQADILEHCRGDRPHVQGCWLIDALTSDCRSGT